MTTKTLLTLICLLSFGLPLAPAADQPAPCCVSAEKEGKTCTHECCVAVKKSDKDAICEKCGGKKDAEKPS